MTVNLSSEDYERYKKELAKKVASKPTSPTVQETREPHCRFLGRIDEVVDTHEIDIDSTDPLPLESYRGLPGLRSIKKWLFLKKK